MEKNLEQSQSTKKMEKPEDWLPGGTEQEQYLKEHKEWRGLEKRLGQPRILNNVYFPEILAWIQEEFKDNPDAFSYFEAGCGHGNDFRTIRKELKARGRYLGVDMSKAEIIHGMKFYKDAEEARKLFAQGDLRNLRHVNIWDRGKRDFSQPVEIKDGEFDLIYMEAVLHGLGYSKKTFQEKKESAQQMLNELYRICKAGGKFFGRASIFGSTITKEKQFELLRKTNNWRFIPEAEEFKEILKKAGFTNIKGALTPHEKAKEDPNKKDILRFSFLAEK
ncbi:MAG: class I SAM-dependent methyltransferase [Patescibacteria group bacterium]|nr:class I SAM-dependent methyltransferase [Patescibacteria group bacterium]